MPWKRSTPPDGSDSGILGRVHHRGDRVVRPDQRRADDAGVGVGDRVLGVVVLRRLARVVEVGHAVRREPLVQALGGVAQHVEVLDRDVVVFIGQIGDVDAGIPAEVIDQHVRREEGVAPVAAVDLRDILEISGRPGVGQPHVVAHLVAVDHGEHFTVGVDVGATHPALGDQLREVDVPGVAAVHQIMNLEAGLQASRSRHRPGRSGW